MHWETVERPGYFGKKKAEIYAKWNKQYGEGNWRIAYQWSNSVISRREGIQLYEDAYVKFLENNPDILNWLINTASDIYDTAETNINSGFDYEIQETPNSHVHDIAIRRAVMRLGKQFKGDHLMWVRWTDSEGFKLCPGKVPFHMPEMIVPGDIKDYQGEGVWWDPDTIEDFYQRNKILQVKKL